jgi:hypothetical protein
LQWGMHRLLRVRNFKMKIYIIHSTFF